MSRILSQNNNTPKRLQKILAKYGIGSRRKIEEFIDTLEVD